MKTSVVISIFVGLLLVGLAVALSGRTDPEPKDLLHWVRAAGGKDWSGEAAQSKPEAQFFLGLTLIRTNLMTMIDRVPLLSRVPLVGRRFVKTTHGLDNNIGAEQLAEAYPWIKKSADQGFPPAKEAEKLFVGRVTAPKRSFQPTHPSAEQSKPN